MSSDAKPDQVLEQLPTEQSQLEQAGRGDLWLPRLRLCFEFILTLAVLMGAAAIALTPETSSAADSGLTALATIVVGYWFGRAAR
jgi:hypothetical protein